MSGVNTLDHSNLQNIGAKLGGVLTSDEKFVTPNGIPIMVVTIIPINKEPITLLTNNTEVMMMPKQLKRTAGLCKLPKVTKVA